MFRGNPFDRRFDSIFREMEREFEEMERRFEQLREQASDQGGREPGQPLVYGWTMRVGPDGRPDVRTFGNAGESAEGLEAGWREPFVTSLVDEEGGVVRVTAELPGVSKENIEVEALPEAVRIQAQGEERKYRTEVPTERRLDTTSAQARYNNGILEVTVQLADPVDPSGTRVDIQ